MLCFKSYWYVYCGWLNICFKICLIVKWRLDNWKYIKVGLIDELIKMKVVVNFIIGGIIVGIGMFEEKKNGK